MNKIKRTLFKLFGKETIEDKVARGLKTIIDMSYKNKMQLYANAIKNNLLEKHFEGDKE